MKEAYGGTGLYVIVITFLLLFTGIMGMTINRSKAYSIKDEIISAIERDNGLNITQSLENSDIAEAMDLGAYRSIGQCPEEYEDNSEYFAFDRFGARVTSADPASLCIKQIDVSDTECYYKVILFYGVDFPMLNEIFTFNVVGESSIVTDCRQVN